MPKPYQKPVVPFDTQGLGHLIEYIKKLSGVDLVPKQQVLEKRLMLFCEARDITGFRNLYEQVQIDRALLQELINLITVNETYFYRELAQLEESMDFIKSLNKPVRVLCAPCASGEEVYSLGMMAIEKGIPEHSLELVGIDINSEAIENSKNALYSSRSLHRLDPSLKQRYFIEQEGMYRVRRERLPKMHFNVINIFDATFLNMRPFDIIFSRNMMIYFNDEFKHKSIQRFHQLLLPHGRLYTGHADLIPTNTLFKKETKGRLSFYVKA